MRDAHVVVVGADPIGLVTALGLARAGAAVTVLETDSTSDLSWSGVHHWSVLPGFERLGVLDDAVGAGFVDHTWCLKVLQTGERIGFDLRVLEGDLLYPYNLHLEQDALCRVLESHLGRYPRTNVERGLSLDSLVQDEDGVVLALSSSEGTRQLRADWVVAADGMKSAVRRALGAGFPGFTWHERCVVALVDYDFSALGYAGTTFQIDDRYGAVVQRVGEGRWRYTYAEPLTQPEDGIGDRIPAVLRAVAPVEAVNVEAWSAARMHQRSAERYRLGRVMLVGDAAHVTNRMTGHSSISGFFDAYALIEALTGVLAGETDDRILDTYAERRRRAFLDHASPVSSSRKHLVSQISDPRRLDTELEYYRQASADPRAHRELLMLTRDLESEPLIPPDTRAARSHC
jgi:3-(3-hydroxy-phenyl)propionate hydroxylase